MAWGTLYFGVRTRKKIPQSARLCAGAFQLPRVIEGGVKVNDSREFDLRRVWHCVAQIKFPRVINSDSPLNDSRQLECGIQNIWCARSPVVVPKRLKRKTFCFTAKDTV